MSDMDLPSETQQPEAGPEAASLRRLRQMVMVLTATMIFGVLAVIILLVIRLNQDLSPPAQMGFPDEITLPAGIDPSDISWGRGWYAAHQDDLLLIYDTQTGLLLQSVKLLKTP